MMNIRWQPYQRPTKVLGVDKHNQDKYRHTVFSGRLHVDTHDVCSNSTVLRLWRHRQWKGHLRAQNSFGRCHHNDSKAYISRYISANVLFTSITKPRNQNLLHLYHWNQPICLSQSPNVHNHMPTRVDSFNPVTFLDITSP